MSRIRLPGWVGIVVASLLGAVLLATVVLAWLDAERIGSRVLSAAGGDPDFETTVVESGGGRVVLSRTPQTIEEGTWGLAASNAYAQVSSVVRIGEDTVERQMQTLEGSLAAGDRVTFDDDAYPGDPSQALGIDFEEVRIPGDLGPNPAWFVDGRRTTWIVIVHGRGHDRRQSLRVLPILVEAGYPVLVVSYRNDGVGAPAPSRYDAWGLDEWRDLDAALAFARRRGAESFVLMGFDVGAEIVATTLDRSVETFDVAGIVFDGPVLDLDDLARAAEPWWAPGPVGALGRQLAAARWSIDWAQVDQVARADRFDVPILVLHGAKDAVVPIATAERFVAARPDLATLVRFERGSHGDLWNTDPDRYVGALSDFLTAVVGSESSSGAGR